MAVDRVTGGHHAKMTTENDTLSVITETMSVDGYRPEASKEVRVLRTAQFHGD